ncbi:hypothetical protein ACTXT7_016842 [Hymenolepis weldensis]
MFKILPKTFLPQTTQNTSSPKNHIADVHENVEAFKCEICEKAFFRKRNLEDHVKAVHENLKPFHCDKFDRAFSSFHALRSHVDGVHRIQIAEEAQNDMKPTLAVAVAMIKPAPE